MKRPESDAGSAEFAAALEAFEKQQASDERPRARVGERVSARIVGFGAESAFVDFGAKAEGLVPLVELTDADGQRTVEVGDTVDGVIASLADDVVTLRVRAGRGPAAPAELQQAYAHGLPVEGVVQAVVKGGVEVTIAGARAFCPVSQLDTRYVEDPALFVGQRLSFRITRFEEGRGRGANLVLSRRILLEEEAQARAAATRASLAVGKVVHGTVSSLATYGAFVDLGGLEGLLHVSELGHGRVGHPSELLSVGQEIEVEIRKIEPPDAKGRERISLSRRSLAPDPWQQEAARLAPGARRNGRVTRLEPFGAFVELAPGVDGLLHVSELSAARGREIRHPREAVQVGDAIDVEVREIDSARRRVSRVVAQPGGEAPVPEPAGSDEGFGALGDFFARAKKRRD